MQSHARSRYPSQLCIRRIRELAIESQVIQNTGLTARGYHIHGSGQEPVKDFHGSPDLVSYGPPVASRQNVGLGFFFFNFTLAYGSLRPLRNLTGDISDSGMTRQLPLVRYSIVWNQ